MRILLQAARVEAPFGRAEQSRAGRLAAAAALQAAGCPVTALGRRADGAPLFPDGYVGAITHTREAAVAVVARGGTGIGVDLETSDVDPKLHRILLDDVERAQLWPNRDRRTLRWLFCAKEAGFKALSDSRDAHGGLFWRVRLSRCDGLLWARAGHDQALVRGGATESFAFAIAEKL